MYFHAMINECYHPIYKSKTKLYNPIHKAISKLPIETFSNFLQAANQTKL